jgi:hypothetical protein
MYYSLGRIITVAVFALVLFLQAPASAEPEKEPANLIRLACPGEIGIPSRDTTVTVDVYISNDRSIGGLSLGFRYSGQGIEIKEVTGSAELPKGGKVITNISPEKQEILLGWIDFTGKMPLPAGKDLKAFTFTFAIAKGTKAQQINIDSTFVMPAGYWVFSPNGGGQVVPAYSDCGKADIIIGKLED